MKITRVIFRESCEAPGSTSKVTYLQTTEPARRDSYAPDLRLTPYGVAAGLELYPMHMVRRCTLAEIEADNAPDLKGLAARGMDDWDHSPRRRAATAAVKP